MPPAPPPARALFASAFRSVLSIDAFFAMRPDPATLAADIAMPIFDLLTQR